MVVVVETIYKVGKFKFDNLEDANTFDDYLVIFSDRQLKQLYLGYKNGINYKVYSNSKFDE